MFFLLTSFASLAFTKDIIDKFQGMTISLDLQTPSQTMHLSQLHTHINNILPQPLAGYQHWTPSPQIVSAVISALRSQPSKPESLLVVLNPPLPLGNSGKSTSLIWASISFSTPDEQMDQVNQHRLSMCCTSCNFTDEQA